MKAASWGKGLSVVTVAALFFLTACGQGGNAPPDDDRKTPSASQSENKKENEGENKKTGESTVSIGTTPVGASYNSIGNGLASVISTNSPIQASVKPFAGPSAWGPLLDKGEIGLGVASGPEVAWAYKGENGYQPIKNMRMLVRGNYIQVTGAVVRKDAKIQKMSDLKGKRLTSDYPGSIISKMVLEAALTANGLSWDDVKKVPVPTTVAGIEALRDNRGDAAFALTPTTPIMVEVHNTVGLQELPFIDNLNPGEMDKIPQHIVEEVQRLVPGARFAVIKPEGYIAQETIGIEYPSAFVASAHLSGETVYTILETLWTHYEKLHPVHDWLKTWTPETMFDPHPVIPYHPGAVQFYKDKGLWNDEAEKSQQAFMQSASK